jgi:cell division protein FtsL
VIELRNKHNRRMLLAEDSSAIKKLTSFQNLYVELILDLENSFLSNSTAIRNCVEWV